MYSQVLVFVLTCLVGAYGIFRSVRSTSICIPQNPCRMQVTVSELGDDSTYNHAESHFCGCRFPFSCSSDWALDSNVVSTQLYSTTSNMTLNLMFCEPVRPRRTCQVGDEALRLSGYSTIPRTLNNYNCRCPGNVPLRLSRRWIGHDFKTYQSYVCDSHMPTCVQALSSCMHFNSTHTEHSCKCPSNLRCRVDVTDSDGITYGSCQV